MKEIIMPILMKHFLVYRGKEKNTLAIYKCADELVKELDKNNEEEKKTI